MLKELMYELNIDINGYKNSLDSELVTQVKAGRKFQVLKNLEISEFNNIRRIEIKLLEDGYLCWVDLKEIASNIFPIKKYDPILMSSQEIQERIPRILDWIELASKEANEYLWGGTIGPNYDCSGLIQSAFASENIWLPRDSYQQEKFCKKITFNPINVNLLLPGDLLFFGSKNKCTHVAIYKGDGYYWHSSGKINGRNGIGIDQLNHKNKDRVSTYYQSTFRNAGRVEFCHDGSTIQ